MRVIILGVTPLAVKTAHELIAGHEVVVIERDEQRIRELHGQLDCAFLHGDGSRPDVLKEADPGRTDARNLKVRRIVTMIEDEDFAPICRERGLEDTIIPLLTISGHPVSLAAKP
jgi:trk/ktr system potassium uptake protein